jgi:hypothetical protein
MIKPIKLLTLVLLFTFFAFRVNAQESKSHKDSLNSIIKTYYEMNLKVFQSDSNVSDIDNIFNLFTEDFTYVHPKYGGTYTRDDLYNGYIRNQKNGGYDGKITDIKILNIIVGLNAVVVEKRFVEKQEDGTKKGESEMTLFEFRKGKIFRIFEYW